MIVVTTNSIEGGTIKRYIDSICTNTVVGTNIFSDFAASFTDFFGGRSGSYKRKLESIYEEARKELELKATRIGANAIIGFRVEFDEISGKDKSMFMVSVSGTACIVEYTKDESKTRVEQIARFVVDEEIEKIKVVEKLQEGSYLKEGWGELLAKLHPQEAIKPLLALYIKSRQSDSTLRDIETIISCYPHEMAEDEIYKEYETLGCNESMLYTLILNCNLFDADHVFSVCKKNLHAGIELLKVKRESYDKEELGKMKEISNYLDSLPDTGKIEKVKSGLLKKEAEMFICENGHKSKKDAEFCENPSCCVNIKGLTPIEVNVINDFKKRICVIESLLNS